MTLMQARQDTKLPGQSSRTSTYRYPKGWSEGIDEGLSWFGIGSSAIAVPFYIIGSFAGSPDYAVSIMNQLIGAATAVLSFFSL